MIIINFGYKILEGIPLKQEKRFKIPTLTKCFLKSWMRFRVLFLLFFTEAMSFLLDNVEESIESLTKRMLKSDLEDFGLVSTN